MTIDRSEILNHFRKNRGLLGIRSKLPVRDEYMLSLLYTPGVAEPCRHINKDTSLALTYTIKGNTVALLSDCSDAMFKRFGPHGLIPFLESHALICRELAAINAYPLTLDIDSDDVFVETAVNLEPGIFGIAVDYCEFPRVLDLLERIQSQVDVPVINIAGEVTAALLLTGFYNASRLLKKKPEEMEILLYGLNSATHALANLAQQSSFSNLRLVDPDGIGSSLKIESERTVPEGVQPHIVVNACEEVPSNLLSSLQRQNFVFDLSSQDHRSESVCHYYHFWNREVLSFHPLLIFPGLFRGMMDCCLAEIPPHFFVKIAENVARLQDDAGLKEGQIFPDPLDLKIAPTVARTVTQLAKDAYPDRDFPAPETIYQRAFEKIYTGERPHAGSAYLKRSKRKKSSESLAKESLELHEQFRGAIEVVAKLPLRDEFMLKIISPPQVQVPAEEILQDPLKVFEYSSKSNLVAVVTDGSAVLGLGNIGAEAALPVMEGKCLLLKTLAGVEGIPLCLRSQDPDVIVRAVAAFRPVLGGVNLEDISAPRCFQIEDQLREITDIPIFHDDQHGTAVVVLAGILNGARNFDLKLGDLDIVINGAGASAIAVTKLLLKVGVGEVILCDTRGAIYEGRSEGMNDMKEKMSRITNRSKRKGGLKEVIQGTKVFLGLSVPDVLNQEMIRTMAKDPLIYALANPNPEIMPDEAQAAGAGLVATGRSDFKNQINNSLAFPGIFRGALDVRAKNINDEMKIAAARAIASLVSDRELRPDYIIPPALDSRVPPQVAAAVAKAALETGQARVLVDPRVIRENTREFLYGGRLDPVMGEPL